MVIDLNSVWSVSTDLPSRYVLLKLGQPFKNYTAANDLIADAKRLVGRVEDGAFIRVLLAREDAREDETETPEPKLGYWLYPEQLKRSDQGKLPDRQSLAERAIRATRDKFAEWGHGPSEDHWKGLREIADVYEGMADGTAKPVRFMSSLPPGMGKTTVAVEATKALLANDRFRNVGVVYFLSRLEEIETLAKLMDLPKEDFAALTSKAEVNALGNPIPQQARVLFTTQQRLEAYSKDGKLFAEIKDLHYRGRTRPVRIWDEAILPSMVLTLDKFALMRLPNELRRLDIKLADAVADFTSELNLSNGNQIQMPDIDRTGLDLDTFRSVFAADTDKDIAEAFWYLSGHVVRVRKDTFSGNVTLGYEDILPPDLAPMLILDASGGLRNTYRFWEQSRGGLERLSSPQKSYAGLTIHHLNKGAGKNKHQDWKSVSDIAGAVCRMVSEIPDGEDVLIIHHKAKPGKNLPDVVKAIRKALPERSGSVEFVNWGRHTATNEFKDCRYVILVGVLSYDHAAYEAIGRGAKKTTVEDDLSDDDFDAVRIGEISHHVFQAAGRGAIRKTINGGCPEDCHLYAIFSTRGGTGFPKEQLSVVFPDADVTDFILSSDRPSKRRLTGKVRQAIEFIESALAINLSVQTTEVREVVAMSKASFKNNVIDHADFKAALGERGIMLTTEKGKPGRFQCAS